MKRIAIIFLSLIVVFTSCSNSDKPSDVLIKIKKEHKSGNYNLPEKFYTVNTVKLLDELGTLTGSKTGNENRKFDEDSDWDVVSENINGDYADVIIRYTAHPVQNMIGLEVPFRLRKEDGKWKIDMENELRKSIEVLKNIMSLKKQNIVK